MYIEGTRVCKWSAPKVILEVERDTAPEDVRKAAHLLDRSLNILRLRSPQTRGQAWPGLQLTAAGGGGLQGRAGPPKHSLEALIPCQDCQASNKACRAKKQNLKKARPWVRRDLEQERDGAAPFPLILARWWCLLQS